MLSAMRAWLRSNIAYILFIGLLLPAMLLGQPKPDLIPIDFGELSVGYANLFTALGGFSITVLAVLLGLEALDREKGGDLGESHIVAVRHVAVSLTLACIASYVGAHLMAEVASLNQGIANRKAEVRSETTNLLKSLRLDDQKVASFWEQIDRTRDQWQVSEPTMDQETMVGFVVAQGTGLSSDQNEQLRLKVRELHDVLRASPRRHFIIASTAAYMATFIVLQSLAMLLMIRFPNAGYLARMMQAAVLGLSFLIFMKLAYTVSYGMVGSNFWASRWLIWALLIIVSLGHRALIRRKSEFPVLAYGASVVALLLVTLFQAATFDSYSGVSLLDRAFVGSIATIFTGIYVSMQIDHPTLSGQWKPALSRQPHRKPL